MFRRIRYEEGLITVSENISNTTSMNALPSQSSSQSSTQASFHREEVKEIRTRLEVIKEENEETNSDKEEPIEIIPLNKIEEIKIIQTNKEIPTSTNNFIIYQNNEEVKNQGETKCQRLNKEFTYSKVFKKSTNEFVKKLEEYFNDKKESMEWTTFLSAF